MASFGQRDRQAAAVSRASDSGGSIGSDPYAKTAADYHRSADAKEKAAAELRDLASKSDLAEVLSGVLAAEAGVVSAMFGGPTNPAGAGMAGVGVIAVGVNAVADIAGDQLREEAARKEKEAEEDRKKAEELEREEYEKNLSFIRDNLGEPLTGEHGDALPPESAAEPNLSYA